MTNRDASITVVVCTRDREAQLKRCLERLQAMLPETSEIIVVDNASKTFSLPNLQYRIRTRFFSQPIPGLSNARNLAIQHAHGEFLAFTDDDAVVDEKWIESALPNFIESDIGCVTGRVLSLETNTEWQQKAAATGWYPDSDQRKEWDRTTFDPFSSFVGVGCNFFVRKSVFDSVKFASDLGAGTPAGGAEDHALFFSVIRNGYTIVYEPKCLVFHEFVSEEKSFNRQVARNQKSRGAYLTRLLLLESGYKMATLKHIFRRLFRSSTNSSVQHSGLTARGILLGPPALFYSMYVSRKRSRKKSFEGHLIAEFSPGSQGPASISV